MADKGGVSRRGFLQGVGAAGAVSCSGFLPFRAAVASDGFFEIAAGRSEHRLYKPDAAASSLWTYNGGLPGPEIRARRGETIKVRLINNLEEGTSIHWHGIRIDNAMDGVSGLTQQAVAPGETFEYEFTSPDAGTYWYHAHNKSWNQVGRGLYGPLIIEEDTQVFDRDHDLTLLLDDWRLDQDGKLHLESFGSMMDWSHAGRLGNWLTVNGKSLPSYTLNAGEAYRLRLVNAANARILELDLAGLGARIVALDGQALEAPMDAPEGPFPLGPAQRADIIMVPKAGQALALREVSGNAPFDVAQFPVSPGSTDQQSHAAMPVLPVNSLPEPDLSKARELTLHMTGGAMGMMGAMTYKGAPLTREIMRETGQLWAFNGVANLPEQSFFAAERGETIAVTVRNDTAFAHAMHSHGHHFRILEQSLPLAPDMNTWRDTFLIAPGETTKIAFVADNPGKWLFHCHMLEHAAAGMTTWFEVA
ncbi:multicopper oxidase family protein [Roseibium sp.]|uniref:multicopper oxidase family protein n=1 Tax=Roseibium sp. TaxID=1936156 RepID=UPI003A976825